MPSFWGLAGFVHKSHPLIGQAQGFVHKTYRPDGYGAHPRPRNAQGMRIHDHRANRATSVTHMHGLRDLAGKMDTPERAAQAQRLLRLSDDLSEPGDLWVICGDFNVEPGSETLRILSARGLTELVTAGGFSGTRSGHYSKPERFAAFMLISDISAAREFTVVTHPEVSDHCPLVLHI